MRLRYARSPRPVVRLVGAGRPNALHALDATREVAGHCDPIRTVSGRHSVDCPPCGGHRHTSPSPQPITRQACGRCPLAACSAVIRSARLFTPTDPVPLAQRGWMGAVSRTVRGCVGHCAANTRRMVGGAARPPRTSEVGHELGPVFLGGRFARQVLDDVVIRLGQRSAIGNHRVDIGPD